MSQSERGLLRMLRSDFRLHGNRLTNLAFYPVANYRFGRWVAGHPSSMLRWLGGKFYGLAMFMIELATGSVIHREATIGQDLHLVHFQNIVVSPETVMGDRVGIMHEVTLGSNMERGNGPTIGNDVFIAVGAKILGKVNVGDRARIGANSVVLSDVPSDAFAIGVPAKIIRYTGRPTPATGDGSGEAGRTV